MLRSLNPETGKPKSAKFHPTAEEAKNFSSEELAYIEKATEDDRELRAQRVLRARQIDALLGSEPVVEDGKKGK